MSISLYAQALKKFEIDCILDQRTFFTSKQNVRITMIISHLLVTLKQSLKLYPEYQNKSLLIFSKIKALNVSINFWEETSSHTENLHKKYFTEEIDTSFIKPILQKINKNIVLPREEIISYKIFKKIAIEPGINLLNHFCKTTNIKINHLIKSQKQSIKEFNCLTYVWYKSILNNSKPIQLVETANETEVSVKNALKLLLKNNYRPVVGENKKGDIILYTDAKNEVCHIGLFHDSKIVESKWGQLPVFLHEPEDAPYDNSYLVLRES